MKWNFLKSRSCGQSIKVMKIKIEFRQIRQNTSEKYDKFLKYPTKILLRRQTFPKVGGAPTPPVIIMPPLISYEG